MKKFFSLVLALVMALSLTTVAWGAPGDVAEVDGVGYSDLQLAINDAATATDKTVTLLDDVTVSLAAGQNYCLLIDAPITFDGAGKTLTFSGAYGSRVINIDTTGNVQIKNLNVVTNGERAFNVINKAVNLTMTNVNATAANYALMVATSAADATVTITGDKSVNYMTGKNVINVAAPGAEVSVEGYTLTCNDTSDAEAYAALILTSTADGATITASDIDFSISGDSSEAWSSANGGVITIDGSGAGVTTAVAVINYANGYSYSFASVQDAIDHAVNKDGASASTPVDVIVLDAAVNSGESFTVPAGVELTLPAGAEMVDDGTGNVVVAPAGTSGTTPAFGTMFYESDDAATKNWRLVSSFPGATVADFLVEADYDETIPEGNIEYYDVNGVAYVEATKATGAYKLVCGKTEVFLNLAADVDYEFEAEAFTGLTTDEDACGSVLVTKKNLSKTYYTATREVSKVEYTYYFVADKAGAVDLLVGGKIVKADMIGDDFSGGAGNAFIAHDWVGNDVDAKTKAYTTLKCENCGKVAKLYANADAAGKGAVYEQYGWITAADAGYDVVVPTTPSTDKVTSADTFDAGIAMYVGMSVMAAAGSAVVIGKKRED